MAETVYTTCPLCEATCGLELTLTDGRITGARGDRGDVLSHGFVCPKGAALGQLDADPDHACAWVGLGLALRGAGRSAAARALLARPELVRAVHRSLRAADAPDPVQLADWIGRFVN